MLEWWIASARFVEYGGAMILFGSPLLLLCGCPFAANPSADKLRWTKHLLLAGAVSLLLATVMGFVAQTALLAGSLGAVSDPSTLKSALLEMNFGLSSSTRVVSAFLAVVTAGYLRAGPSLWRLCLILGAIACASFSWMGHGAATEGGGWLIHLAADISHGWAAAGWIGALIVFSIMLTRPISPGDDQKALCASLAGFSGMGTLLVAVIVASGLFNSFFLVGWNPAQILATPYGQILAIKLVLFTVMLSLAAANRFRHTPALARALQTSAQTKLEFARLRQSIFLETIVAGSVLGLVSWLGMLAPVTGP